MADNQELKVFISWSGGLSKTIAQALREWLPGISDRIKPFMSDADIEAGQRGLSTIEKELSGTSFGIIVVTHQNQNAPWLNFEAGALSKVVGPDVEGRVAPLLVDISNPSQITGPISQFQGKVFNKAGMLDVVNSIAVAAGADLAQVKKRYLAFWPDLKKSVEDAVEVDEIIGDPVKRPTDEMVEEILNIVRAMRAEQSNEGLTPLVWTEYRMRDSVVRNIEKTAEFISQIGLEAEEIEPAGDDSGDDLWVTLTVALEDDHAEQLAADINKRLGIKVRIFGPH